MLAPTPKILMRKNFGQKVMEVPKTFLANKKIMSQKKKFGSDKFFTSEKYFGSEKIVIFHQRSSSIRDCLTSKVIFHQMKEVCPRKFKIWKRVICQNIFLISSLLLPGSILGPFVFSITDTSQGLLKQNALWLHLLSGTGVNYQCSVTHELMRFRAHRLTGSHAFIFLDQELSLVLFHRLSIFVHNFDFCSAWLRLKLNTKIGLHTI